MYLYSEETNWCSHKQSETQQHFFVLAKVDDNLNGIEKGSLLGYVAQGRKCAWHHLTNISESAPVGIT